MLVPIDICSKVIKSRSATLDVELSNKKTLILDLKVFDTKHVGRS